MFYAVSVKDKGLQKEFIGIMSISNLSEELTLVAIRSFIEGFFVTIIIGVIRSYIIVSSSSIQLSSLSLTRKN